MSTYKELFYNDIVVAKHNKEFGKILQRVDYSDFSNYIFHASAYQTIYNNVLQILNEYPINTSSTSSSNANLIEKYNLFIAENTSLIEYLVDQFPNKIIITDHDGTTGSYSNIRRDILNKMIEQTDIDFVDGLLEEADNYDTGNQFKAENLIPQYLMMIDENDIMKKLLHIIGYNFDQIRISAQQLSKQLHTNYTDYNKFAIGSERHVAKLLGLDLVDGQFEKTLAEYLLRDNMSDSLKSVTQQIWNRLLNNLPYILKTKGTKESIKAILNCYGISSSFIRINEYSYTVRPYLHTINIDSVTSSEYVLGEFEDNEKIKISSPDDDFRNINKIGISFNPVDEIDKDILNSIAPLNIGTVISWPEIFFDRKHKYPKVLEIADTYFNGQTYDFNTFIRFIEDFDKGLFYTVKQVIPARTKLVNEGVTIRSHLLEKIRLTDGKLFQSIDLTKRTTIESPVIPTAENLLQSGEINSSITPIISNIIQSAEVETQPLPIITNQLKEAVFQPQIDRNTYDYDPNVVSTSEITNIQLNNYVNSIYQNIHLYSYENKYYTENRLLRYDIPTERDTRIVGTITDTSFSTSSASAECVIKYSLDDKPLEYTKIRIVLPVSSQGARLLELKKNSSWTDYFQSLDCNDTNISLNSKINIFEFYTDSNGEVKLTLHNNNIRTGVVPIFFYDEKQIQQSRIDIDITGLQEQGSYAT